MLLEEVKRNLDTIKNTQGVENAVLTQRDGNPIQHSGIRLSQEEIFSICSASSAIYNCGLQLHIDTLKYILIEGVKAKVLISPLKNHGNLTLNRIIDAQGLQGNDFEYFISMTTQPMINLGGIFLKTKNSLINIKKELILSGESFKPPLRHFSQNYIQENLQNKELKENLEQSDTISLFSFNISSELNFDLDQILKEFSSHTLDLMDTFITTQGGFIISSIFKTSELSFDIDKKATMSHVLFLTAQKCAWFLKKMSISSILLECEENFQFIQKVGKGIFSATIAKGRQKLGLLRLIIPRYAKKIENILAEISNQPLNVQNIEIKNLFTEIIL